MQVLVHGGAGSDPAEPIERRAVLERAAETGATRSSPLDAVEAAVRVLESDPRFNAGIGGAVQSDGVVRTDAGLMTDDRSVGAVCSMTGVEHAVTVARLVLEETPHVLVSGSRAVSLADAYGVETAVDLRSDRTRDRWADLEAPRGVKPQLEWLRDRYGRSDPGGRDQCDDRDDDSCSDDGDTVGAVAFDGTSLAAATSTGGRWVALAGRVGDVPQIGSGFYCSPASAVSATGAGEDIARVTLSRRTAAHVESGCDAQEATARAVDEFEELTGSTAGVIAVDARGRAGSAYNTPAMQTARATERS